MNNNIAKYDSLGRLSEMTGETQFYACKVLESPKERFAVVSPDKCPVEHLESYLLGESKELGVNLKRIGQALGWNLRYQFNMSKKIG